MSNSYENVGSGYYYSTPLMGSADQNYLIIPTHYLTINPYYIREDSIKFKSIFSTNSALRD